MRRRDVRARICPHRQHRVGGMSDNWGGAQWVVVTIMIIQTLLPIGARIVGLQVPGKERDTGVVFFGRQVGGLIWRIGAVLILGWGGFWA